METYEKWELLRDIMSDSDLLEELYYTMSNSEIEDFIENVVNLYNLERSDFGYED